MFFSILVMIPPVTCMLASLLSSYYLLSPIPSLSLLLLTKFFINFWANFNPHFPQALILSPYIFWAEERQSKNLPFKTTLTRAMLIISD